MRSTAARWLRIRTIHPLVGYLVAIEADKVGNFRAYAFGTSPTGGVVNFNILSPAMNNSNTIVVPIDSNGDLVVDVNSPSAAGPVVHARGVILGYYN